MTKDALWLFGYGSLVWRPAFAYRRRHPASIAGFARRFWQGSTDHRGVPERPGRVVTLLRSDAPELASTASAEEPEVGAAPVAPMRAGLPVCWGTAYEVAAADREEVLATLDHRERGGYARFEVDVTLAPGTLAARRVEGLVYVAEPSNRNYLGPAPIGAIARQIARASGPSGANPEYVFELARSLRAMGARDAHVFAVERALAALVGKSRS